MSSRSQPGLNYPSTGARRSAGAARSGGGAVDSLIIWLLLALVGLCIASGVRRHMSLSDTSSGGSLAGMNPTMVWTGVAVALVLFFAVTAPLVLLGVFITSKIFRFELAMGAYFRAAGVAAAPVVLAIGSSFLPPNVVVRLLCFVLSIPLAYLIARQAFGMTGTETLVAAALCVPFFVGAMLLNALITAAAVIAAGSGRNFTSRSYAIGSSPSNAPLVAPTPSNPLPKPSPAVVAPAAPKITDADRIEHLKQQADELSQTDLSKVSLGWARARIATLRNEAATLGARSGVNDGLRKIAQTLDGVEAKLAAAPTPQPPAPPPAQTRLDPKPSALQSPAVVAPAPQNLDPIGTALADLHSGDHFRKRDALRTLASTARDPNRADVTRAIEQIVLSEDLSLRKESADALAAWADEQTVLKLIPWLDEKAGMFRVETAMTVLSASKDKRAVFPILRWIIKKPEPVVKALTAMGPVAEDDVVKILRERDATARVHAARILQEIGGQKSLIPLQRAAADPRDVSAAQAAKLALEVVRERVKQSKSPATNVH